MRRSVVSAIGVIAFLVASAGATAQTQVGLAANWWLTGADGEINFGSAPVNIDEGIGGSGIEYGFNGRLDLDWGEWGAHGDVTLMGLETTASLLAPGDGIVDASVSSDLFLGEAVVYREIAGANWDVYAGGRIGSVDATATWASTGSGLLSNDSSWFDPIFGLRFASSGGGPLFGHARADVGGFGVGSNFTLNAVGKVGYQVFGSVSLEAGAKWISIDFEDGNPASGGFLYDISHFGFLFGVGINTAK